MQPSANYLQLQVCAGSVAIYETQSRYSVVILFSNVFNNFIVSAEDRLSFFAISDRDLIEICKEICRSGQQDSEQEE